MHTGCLFLLSSRNEFIREVTAAWKSWVVLKKEKAKLLRAGTLDRFNGSLDTAVTALATSEEVKNILRLVPNDVAISAAIQNEVDLRAEIAA